MPPRPPSRTTAPPAAAAGTTAIAVPPDQVDAGTSIADTKPPRTASSGSSPRDEQPTTQNAMRARAPPHRERDQQRQRARVIVSATSFGSWSSPRYRTRLSIEYVPKTRRARSDILPGSASARHSRPWRSCGRRRAMMATSLPSCPAMHCCRDALMEADDGDQQARADHRAGDDLERANFCTPCAITA